MNERNHFEIFVSRNTTGSYFWKVDVNWGEAATHMDEINSPENHPSAQLYLSDPMHPSFTSEYGVLDKLKIVNLEKEIQIKM